MRTPKERAEAMEKRAAELREVADRRAAIDYGGLPADCEKARKALLKVCVAADYGHVDEAKILRAACDALDAIRARVFSARCAELDAK